MRRDPILDLDLTNLLLPGHRADPRTAAILRPPDRHDGFGRGGYAGVRLVLLRVIELQTLLKEGLWFILSRGG